MPEPFAVAGADYLEQLLRAAIHVPAAAADPAAGRVVARLMVALGAKGEDDRLEPYLSCSPGRRSVYEVTCYDEGDRPAACLTDLAAGQAIRATARFAAARRDRTVAVFARDDAGHERCVMVARGPTATYQFPEPGAVAGGGPGPADGAASASRPDPSEASWVALTERLESIPTTDEVVKALRNALDGVTIELRDRLGSLPTTDEVVSALRDLLGGMTIELDATAIEDVIHAALEELPRLAAAAPPTVAQELDESAAAMVAEVVGNGQAPAEEPTGIDTTAAPNPVSVATLVSDQASDSSPGQREHRTGHRGRVNPAAVSHQVTIRPPSDRAVEDALALVALSGGRH